MKTISGYWALNTRKGTTINNDDIGRLEGGVAIPISERQTKIAKHLRDVVVLYAVVVPEEKEEK